MKNVTNEELQELGGKGSGIRFELTDLTLPGKQKSPKWVILFIYTKGRSFDMILASLEPFCRNYRLLYDGKAEEQYREKVPGTREKHPNKFVESSGLNLIRLIV